MHAIAAVANADESDAAASAEYDHMVDTEHDGLSASDGYESPSLTVHGYAILEFPDSYFYLHENSIVIGRNTEAERLHKLKQARGMRDWNPGALRNETEGNQADPQHDNFPEKISDPGNGHITVEGGTGGPQSSRHQSLELEQDEEFIAVHPPADANDNSVFHFRGISKKHLRVKLDEDFSWMVEILGRNGAYVNERYHPQGDRVFLDDKDVITISSLPIRFHISDVILDDEDVETGQTSSVEEAEQDAEEGVNGISEEEEEDEDDEDETLLNGAGLTHGDADSNDDEEDERDGSQPKPAKTKIKLNLKGPKTEKPKSTTRRAKDGKAILGKSKKAVESGAGQTEDQPKRRGPGRPPADGVMSKRERRERERAAKAGVEYGEPIPAKPKGRLKGSPGSGDEEEGIENGETGEKAVKNRKRKRSEAEAPADTNGVADEAEEVEEEPPPPPRSPSPKEEDYTEAQLAKPDKTYHALLHEILEKSPQALALPQIYSKIRKEWPWFRFRVNGTGWESSVRHNLGNNKHFKTAGKAGKGFFWTIDPSVPFEPKTKRTTEPSRVVPYYPSTPNNPRPQHTFQPRPPNPLTNNNIGTNSYQGSQSGQAGQFGQTSLQVNGQGPLGAGPATASSQPYAHYSTQQHAPNFTNSQPYAQHQTQFHAQTSLNHTNSPVPNIQHMSTAPIPGINRTPPDGFRPAHPQTSISGPPALQNPGVVQAGRPSPYTPQAGPANVQQQQQQQQQPSSCPPPSTNPSPGLERHIAQRRLTAFEQLDRGETPRVFQRFRDTLSKSAVDNSEARHLRTTAQSAIDWIVARPHADAKEDDTAHPSIKPIVKILRDLLVEDYKTSGAKAQGTQSPNTNNTTAANRSAGNASGHGITSTGGSVQMGTGGPSNNLQQGFANAAPTAVSNPATAPSQAPATASHSLAYSPPSSSTNNNALTSTQSPAPPAVAQGLNPVVPSSSTVHDSRDAATAPTPSTLQSSTTTIPSLVASPSTNDHHHQQAADKSHATNPTEANKKE